MKKLKFHPFLNQVPMMPLHERDALGADIEKHGQLIPIVTYHGEIIDGRNRYLACLSRNIEPTIIEMTKMDAKDVVNSMNYLRKHWTTKERAHFAALMSLDSEIGRPEKSEENGSNDPIISQTEAAKQMGVSVKSVKRAKAKIKGKKQRPKKDESGKPVDKIGYPVTQEALPNWERRQEVLDILHHISTARSALRNTPRDDKFYWYVKLGSIERELDSTYNQLAGVLPDYVCAHCHGVNVDKCEVCHGTGVLSETLWRRLYKGLREKHEQRARS
jgi:hypothetical protein